MDPDFIMLWEAWCLRFFEFLRAREMTVLSDSMYYPATHLSQSDLAVDNPNAPTVMKVLIKQSKTDPFLMRNLFFFLASFNFFLASFNFFLASFKHWENSNHRLSKLGSLSYKESINTKVTWEHADTDGRITHGFDEAISEQVW